MAESIWDGSVLTHSPECSTKAPCSRGPWSPEDIRRGMHLYAVTDSAWLGERTLAECVEQAVENGATFVQLREKHASTEEIVGLAQTIIPICRAHRVPFLIDDDVEAAKLAGADGVHVGQSDTACAEARRRQSRRPVPPRKPAPTTSASGRSSPRPPSPTRSMSPRTSSRGSAAP